MARKPEHIEEQHTADIVDVITDFINNKENIESVLSTVSLRPFGNLYEVLQRVVSLPDKDKKIPVVFFELSQHGFSPSQISQDKTLKEHYWPSVSKVLPVGKPQENAKNLKLLFLEWVQAEAFQVKHNAQRRGTFFAKEGFSVATGTQEIRATLEGLKFRDGKGNLENMPEEEVNYLYEQVCGSLDNAQKRSTGRTPTTQQFYDDVDKARNLLEAGFKQHHLDRESVLEGLQTADLSQRIARPSTIPEHDAKRIEEFRFTQMQRHFLNQVKELVNLHRYDQTTKDNKPADGVQAIRKILKSVAVDSITEFDVNRYYENVSTELEAIAKRNSDRPDEVRALYDALQRMKTQCEESRPSPGLISERPRTPSL